MGISITKNTLPRFNERLQLTRGIADKLALEFITEAKQIAEREYAGFDGIEISYEKVENGVYQLFVAGEGLWYLEFGTGNVGESSGYPQENLPKQTLSFESPKGKPQSTQGYVYYYPNSYTKVNGGWYYTNENGERVFTKGQTAGFQMYNTAQELGRRISEIAKEYAKRRKQ